MGTMAWLGSSAWPATVRQPAAPAAATSAGPGRPSAMSCAGPLGASQQAMDAYKATHLLPERANGLQQQAQEEGSARPGEAPHALHQPRSALRVQCKWAGGPQAA